MPETSTMPVHDDGSLPRDAISAEYWIKNDERFCEAMLLAVSRGAEHPPALEIVKNETPPPPGARIYAVLPPPRSHTGSTADWCAEYGDVTQW